MQPKSTVLVTGASGFIDGHCILALLKRGYAVRGTVRSKSQIEKCQALIHWHYGDRANLDSDEGWDAAVKDCEYVLHLASPLPYSKNFKRKSKTVFFKKRLN